MMESAKAIGCKIINDRQSIKICIEANNEVFNNKINLINSKDYTRIKQLGVFQLINNVFYFHASKYESVDSTAVEEYIIKVLNHYYSNYQCSYAIAYIHSSIFDYLAFKTFIKGWPEHFFHRLRKIYIVGVSFMVKLVQNLSCGTLSRLYDQLFFNLTDLRDLKDIDEAIMIQGGQNPQTPKGCKEKVKIIQSNLYGKELAQYDLFANKYPTIILRLLAKLVRNPYQLRLQGIFRKSCSSEGLQKLQLELQAKNWKAIEMEQDILVVCGCLKKILNNLKVPLFNYQIYDKVIAYGGGETGFIKSMLRNMQYTNNKLFTLLIVFMRELIMVQENYNNMNDYNLSVVFGPCFFRPKQYQLKDIFYSGKIVRFILTCFQKHHQIFEKGQRIESQEILRGLIQRKLKLDDQ